MNGRKQKKSERVFVTTSEWNDEPCFELSVGNARILFNRLQVEPESYFETPFCVIGFCNSSVSVTWEQLASVFAEYLRIVARSDMSEDDLHYEQSSVAYDFKATYRKPKHHVFVHDAEKKEDELDGMSRAELLNVISNRRLPLRVTKRCSNDRLRVRIRAAIRSAAKSAPAPRPGGGITTKVETNMHRAQGRRARALVEMRKRIAAMTGKQLSRVSFSLGYPVRAGESKHSIAKRLRGDFKDRIYKVNSTEYSDYTDVFRKYMDKGE